MEGSGRALAEQRLLLAGEPGAATGTAPGRAAEVTMHRVSCRLTLTCQGAAEELDHFTVECGDVIRLAAGDEIAIDHHFLIHPFRAGVLKIGLERWP